MENNELDNVSLLKKAYAKLKSSKIVQKLMALTMATATVLTLAGCEELPVPPTPDDLPSFNIGGNQDNQDKTPDKNENRNPIDVSGYSQLLQDILLDEHYDELLYNIESNKSYELWETGTFEPHPYAFYESQGYDVEAIKNDEIEAYTMSYVLDDEPNNLYMYTRVMQDNSYWTNYLLKYTLTDQEMEDYHFLHTGEGRTVYFIQAVLMNNAISKTRTPEIVGTSKMSVDAFEDMTKEFENLKNFDRTNYMDLIFLNPNKENLTFDTILIPRYNDKTRMCFNEYIVKLDGKSYELRFDGDIFTGPIGIQLSFSNRRECDATFYFSQDANMNYMYCESLEKVND